MARLQGLLKRPSKAEELELELARQGSVARLERLLAQRAGTYVEDDEEALEVDESAEVDEPAEQGASAEPPEAPAESAEPVAATAVGAESTEGLLEPDEVTASERPQENAGIATDSAVGVPVMARDAVDAARPKAVRHRTSAIAPAGEWDHFVLVVKDEWDRSAANGSDGENGAHSDREASPAAAVLSDAEAMATIETTAEADTPSTSEAMATIETPVAGESLTAPLAHAARPRPRRTSAASTDTPTKVTTGRKTPSERPSSSRKRAADPPPPPRVRAAPSGAVHPRRAPRQPRQPAVLAACPSCAVLLDPRPTASRRCSQCRERIVVKRLEGGVLYLTGPAAAALEAGQRRIKETARLARIRDRWLAQASAVGASPAAIERIGRATATEEGVQAARELYLGAANRAYVAANRERRFAEAASIRRAHVLALIREQGASAPVADEVIALYRDAMSAELKSQREFGRDAELVAAPCCDACAVDNGLVVRISEEVKTARLPHAGCPKGVCQCRWLPARVAGRRAVAKVGSVR